VYAPLSRASKDDCWRVPVCADVDSEFFVAARTGGIAFEVALPCAVPVAAVELGGAVAADRSLELAELTSVERASVVEEGLGAFAPESSTGADESCTAASDFGGVYVADSVA
jgi:hypothetical protein